MKKFLLLGDNKESGPYSTVQLADLGLFANYLVWIENESNSWKYAEEIPECVPLINEELARSQSVLLNQTPQKINEEPEANAIVNDGFKSPVHTSHKQKSVHFSNTAAILAVSFGVMLAAPVVKSIVEYRTANNRSEAIPVIDRQEHTKPGLNFKRTIVTEIVPVYRKTQSRQTQKNNKQKQASAAQISRCELAAFDGINGLQLTAFNTSSEWIDKALVSVDYLLPNGDIANSENLLFTSIKPHDAQTIGIPSSPRGVRLRYMVLKVYSHKYKPVEKHI